MPPSNRRPTAEELEELSDASQRDPGGEAASRLAAAYLALGRPRDALDVGAKALRFKPDSLEARALVGEAFAALHQWDRAKDELLKVVKVDRRNRRAARLLGESLMRQGDLQRALPVLQHAHNLDPEDPKVYDLLRRARMGEPPGAPDPVPTPVAPGPSRRVAWDDEPTRQVAASEALGRMSVEKAAVSSEPAPVDRPAGGDPRASDAPEGRGVEHHQPPPPEKPLAPLGESGPTSAAPANQAPKATMFGAPPIPHAGDAGAPPAQPKSQPPPGGPVGGSQPPPGGPVGAPPAEQPPAGAAPEPPKKKKKPAPAPGNPAARPRVFADDKPIEAAQGSLKQAAAVGEQYLNHLLTSGLLAVPNVRSPQVSLEVAPFRPWRRTWRLFAYLFVLLGIGAVASTGWYYYTEQQRAADLERHVAEAERLLWSGAYADVKAAVEESERAMDRSPDSALAMATFAETGGVAAIVYGIVKPDDVRLAVERAGREVEAGAPAYRSVLIGRAAVTLTSLDERDDPVARLAATGEELGSWLEEHQDDHGVRWLLGKVHAAGGRRDAAREAFERAHADGEGTPLAAVALADMALDDGDFDRAETLYGGVLTEDEGAGEGEDGNEEESRHELALVGSVLAGTERTTEDPFEAANDAFDVLSVSLADEKGTRLEAYKQAAEAAARLLIQDYEAMREAIDAALELEVRDPRLLARLGLGRIAEGDIGGATEIRTQIRWYGEDPQPHPLVQVLDAELLLAQGRPERALAELDGRSDLRALRVRGRALFELGEYDRAAEELAAAREIAPTDFEAEVWAMATELASGGEAAREEASDELTAIARGARTRGVHYARGAAYLAAGDPREARRSIETSLDRVSGESPNPLAYEARTQLARLVLAEGEPEAAIEHLRAALEHNATYLPAHALLGEVLVEAGDAEAALDHLLPVIDAGVATANAELAFARALAREGGDDARAQAAEALKRAADKGAEPEVLAEIAEELGDEALAGELGSE